MGPCAGRARLKQAHWDTTAPSPSPHLCVMKLHGVVGREGDVQPLVQEFPQRVLGIFQEKAVVAKRRHGNGDLGEVVEVLQHWTLRKNRHTRVTHAGRDRTHFHQWSQSLAWL